MGFVFIIGMTGFQVSAQPQANQYMTLCDMLPAYQDLRISVDDIDSFQRRNINFNQPCGLFEHKPLHLAVIANYSPYKKEIIRALIRAGANPHIGNTHEQTPIMMAEQKTRLEEQELWQAEADFKTAFELYERNSETQDTNYFLAYQEAQVELVNAQREYDQIVEVIEILKDAMDAIPVPVLNICELVSWWELKITRTDVASFVQNNVEMNQSCDFANNSPLHLVARTQDNGEKIHVIEAMVLANADLLARNLDGLRPVDLSEEFLSWKREAVQTTRQRLIQANNDLNQGIQSDRVDLFERLTLRETSYNEAVQQEAWADAVHEYLVVETNKRTQSN